jgi:1-acyl-sn-glycerol-3-phosphate acyltransferase
MQGSPRRLRRFSGARPFFSPGNAGRDRAEARAFPPGAGEPRFARGLAAAWRAALVLLWTLLAVSLQAVCILLPGCPKIVFPRLYWSGFCRVLGLRVRVIGAPSWRGGGRPVVFVANHCSWLDIPVLGGRLEACFISKADVMRWPLVSTVARLGRTVFVSRQRISTARERDEISERLAGGDNLVLFPEGTTSDGSRVLPFRSSFFAVAEGERPPLIQPVSVVYDRLAGLPTGRANRPLFAWYGDMDIAPHFWRLARQRGLRATVLLHGPLDPANFPNRKALAAAVWSAVAEGAAALRQNRPAQPVQADPLKQPGEPRLALA